MVFKSTRPNKRNLAAMCGDPLDGITNPRVRKSARLVALAREQEQTQTPPQTPAKSPETPQDTVRILDNLPFLFPDAFPPPETAEERQCRLKAVYDAMPYTLPEKSTETHEERLKRLFPRTCGHSEASNSSEVAVSPECYNSSVRSFQEAAIPGYKTSRGVRMMLEAAHIHSIEAGSTLEATRKRVEQMKAHVERLQAKNESRKMKWGCLKDEPMDLQRRLARKLQWLAEMNGISGIDGNDMIPAFLGLLGQKKQGNQDVAEGESNAEMGDEEDGYFGDTENDSDKKESCHEEDCMEIDD
ncbi:hypothetical protein EDC01DRAFT_782573 [Geopyxis carbonaria]|nr:hypothetical protein EDC01DRAFT_782573 [Geopyxis carbonaria]